MSGFEWFFTILSAVLMGGSLWVRTLEDRAIPLMKSRRRRPCRR
jgi:hypothetical protein